MAISVSFVTHANITTGDSVATASQSPAANELWVVDVYMRGTGITPSVSGTGLTWTQEAQVDAVQSGPQLRLWRFRGLSASTPSSGAITVTVTGNTKPVLIQVWKATGINTGGTNGSGAFAQTVTDQGPATDDANMLKALTTINDNAVVVALGGHRTRTYTLQSGETAVDLNYTAGTGGDVATASVFYKTVASHGSVTLGASGSLSGAIDWAMIVSELKQGNVTFNDTITLAKTLAVSVTKNSNAFGSASLGRSEGLTVTKQSNAQGSTTLARSEGIAVTKQSNAQGSTTFARSEGLTVAKQSNTYGSVALARTEGASVAGVARYQVSVSLSRSEGLTVAERANAIALITLPRSEGVTVTKQSNTQGSVGLGKTLAIVNEPQADTYGDTSIAIHRSLAATASRLVSAELSLGRSLTLNGPEVIRSFIAIVNLDIHRSLSVQGQPIFPVSVALQRSLSIAVAKQIAADGYVTLPVALAVSVDGEQVVVTIITPDSRTLSVIPETRSFAIDHALDIDMAGEDRGFDV